MLAMNCKKYAQCVRIPVGSCKYQAMWTPLAQNTNIL